MKRRPRPTFVSSGPSARRVCYSRAGGRSDCAQAGGGCGRGSRGAEASPRPFGRGPAVGNKRAEAAQHPALQQHTACARKREAKRPHAQVRQGVERY
ncbi:hypothetical protein NDU88_006442 [Pleurodeles waltl]|uniref:Uncharacterized protein n=1 Tax=Pleurodeles waltl TaxID=8319 RepID=A0AAV7SPM8_PLEWA|nr:hypothetical protein NDU88_006442 [Pleurodeles waltl]